MVVLALAFAWRKFTTSDWGLIDMARFSARPPKVQHLKPEKFRDYLTTGEVARKVNRDITRIRALDKQDKIPKAVRHKIGKLEIRLYSPAAVQEIEQIVGRLKPGRPRKGGANV